MGIKLIAIDLDGTLLDNQKKVSEKNLLALSRCAVKRIDIVPATGRTVHGIPEEIKNLPGVRYSIAANGAVVWDLAENSIIYSCRLPVEIALDIMKLAKDSADDIMYDAYLDGIGISMECFMNRLDIYAWTAGMQDLVRKTRRTVPDSINYVRSEGREVDKINMFFREMDAKERMREQLKTISGIAVTSSIPNNLEINAVGADKGSALLRLADYLHIEQEAVMAIGDGENDLTMIRNAGVGVAMENGGPEIREAADYVTSANEESGVADAIEKFALK